MNKEQYFDYLNEKPNDEKLNELETYAKSHHVPIIQESGLEFVSMIIKVSQAKKILEIGTAIGYSAINFARINEAISVTTIERDEEMIEQAKKNIQEFNLTNRIELISQDALLVDESNLSNNYDLLFIDAAKSQYQKFFEKYTKCLKTGGIVVTDNLVFHDMIFDDDIKNRNTKQLVSKIKKYNEWLKNNDLFDTQFFSIGDGISISIKK
ncbi:O-methyltransferase [Mycoplasmatota bacterium]|nr:O-methyltransferase [Mycoplasmatota bacterium]